MNININQAIGKAGERWSSLSRRRKGVVVGIGAALLIGLVILGQWMTRVEYAPLFTDLPEDQSGAIVEKLDEMKVDYKIDEDGKTILVPKDQLYKTRLELAGSGALEGSEKGFELFDQSQLGTTDFERRLNYQRALQEELRRTISCLDEVEMARVHLVLPEDSLYAEDELPASASIVLDLKPLAELKPEQVKGIIYLVSASVENLPPENVNIIDTSGNILSEGIVQAKDDKSGVLDTNQEEMKEAFENNLEKRVGKMLERIVGPGKAVVMVTADLSFDQRQVTRIDYGDDGVVRSEELVEKNSTSTGGVAGVPGSTTNVGTYGAAQTGGQSTTTERSEKRNYEIDETKENTVYAPGQVVNLSTSVAVDGDLSAYDVDQIQGIVQAAVGYNPERGDQINVVSRSFDNSAVKQAEAEMQAEKKKQQQQERLKRYIIGGLLALVGIVGVTALIIRRRRKQQEDFVPEEGEFYPIPVSEMAAMSEPEIGEIKGKIPEPETEEILKPVLTEEEEKRKRNFDQVKEIAATKPEEAAALIRAWLTEE